MSGSRHLRREERRRLAVLGLPTFGMALSITVVSTYVPVVARDFHASTIAVGLIIGAEGLTALWLPVVVGSASDRLRTRIGGRLPFVLAGTPVMAAGLVAVGAVASLAAVAVAVAVFFVGYFVAYEPYRALFPDLVPDEAAGRSQSAQAGWRGAGTVVALAAGGALLSVSRALPFAASAAALLLSVAVFFVLARHGKATQSGSPGSSESGSPGARQAFRRLFELLREHPALRGYVVANALWELSLGAVKTFVVLYVTVGLGLKLGSASLAIGAVAVVVLLGALLSGKLADTYGKLRVAEIGIWVYGITLFVPGLFPSPLPILLAMPFIAFGGGMLMSLPYSLLMPLMPEDEHGMLTGLYSLSRGVGVMLGPLLAGVAIQAAEPLLSSTDGYAAMWLVAGTAILLSGPVLHSIGARGEDRRRLREA